MAKRDMDWVVSGNEDFLGFGGTWGDFSRTSTAVSESIVAMALESDPIDKTHEEDECIIERVVGQVHCWITNAAAADGSPRSFAGYVSLRLHVGIHDISTGAPATPSQSLDTSSDAEEKFLWHRRVPVSFNTADLSSPVLGSFQRLQLMDAWYSAVDVRVNRKLNYGMALILSAQMDQEFAAPGFTQVTWATQSRLRTLVMYP